MKLRVLALVGLGVVVLPLMAAEVITQDVRINRQRITNVINAPGYKPMPCTDEVCINRQRITSIYDMPGMVRKGLPRDRQLDRCRIDKLPLPKKIDKPKEDEKSAPKKEDSSKPEEKSSKEKVKLQTSTELQKGTSGKLAESTLAVAEWSNGQILKDDQGRMWSLMQGTRQTSRPKELTGWLLQSGEGPTVFYSQSGTMWRLVSRP